MYTNNISNGLEELRLKIKEIKQKNELVLKNRKFKSKNHETSFGNINDERREYGFLSAEETAAVEKCYQNSLKLIEQHNKLKKKKKTNKCYSIYATENQREPPHNKNELCKGSSLKDSLMKNEQNLPPQSCITFSNKQSNIPVDSLSCNLKQEKRNNQLSEINLFRKIEVVTISDENDSPYSSNSTSNCNFSYKPGKKQTNKLACSGQSIFSKNSCTKKSSSCPFKKINTETDKIFIDTNKTRKCDSTNILKNKFKSHKKQKTISKEEFLHDEDSKNMFLDQCSKHQSSSTERYDSNVNHIETIGIDSQEENCIPDILYLKSVNSFPEIITIPDELSKENCVDSEVGTEDTTISRSSCSNSLTENIEISDDEVIEIREELPEPIVPTLDFTEEPVDFPIPTLHMKETVEYITEEEREKLLSQGISIKIGHWSKAETSLLIRNYNNFVKQYGVSDARLLLGIGRSISANKTEFSIVQKFLKAKHFFVQLGRGLNCRTLKDIYYKARHLFHPLRNLRKWTSSDLLTLRQLQKKYGNQWQVIGQKMGFPSDQCEKYYNYHKKITKKGKWSDKEKQKLIAAVKDVTKVSDLSNMNHKRIAWTKVSELVQSRSAQQCRRQWHTHLEEEIHPLNDQKWDRKCSANLITLLRCNHAISEEADIDWEELLQIFKNVVPTTYCLRQKWYGMKQRVPVNIKKNYRYLISHLSKKYCTDLN